MLESRHGLDIEQNRLQIWDSEVLEEHVWGTFDLLVFKVIFGIFHAPDL